MRTLAKIFLVASLLVTGGTLEAQRPGQTLRPMRPLLRRAMADPARRQALRQRVQSLAPGQRAAMKQRMSAARAERRQLAQQLRSGHITRVQARLQMREWRQANRTQSPRAAARRPLQP